MVLEDACFMLKADPQTAEGLLPLFEERNKSKHADNDDHEELKSACGAAIVSRLLMCILAPNEKKARPRCEGGSNGSPSRESSAEDSDPSDSMVDLATSLAQFIEDSCKGASGTEPTNSTPLTALDVVRYCTRLLSKSGIVTKLVFGEHSGGNGDEEIQKKLDLVVSMLNGIEHEIKAEMSLYLEFEQIWSWAAREEFYTASLVNPKEMRGSRECAWLLQCLLYLTVCNSPEYQKDIYLLRRSLVGAAVCLLFEVMAGYRDPTTSVPEPACKKRKTTEDAEQDAIAALSMMTNPASPSPPSLSETTTDLGTTLQLSSRAEHVRRQFCDKMSIDSDLFHSSMNLIIKFLEDQRGITKTNVGTTKVLNILRCMYRDLRLDHVNPTGAIGVVNHMELYHSDSIRRSLIGLADITMEQKASSVKKQNAKVALQKESTNALLNNKPATVISSAKNAVNISLPNDVSSWLSRLYSDPSLAKPSNTLTQHFDHSGGVALWQSITVILDRALQRLLDYVGDTFLCSSPGKVNRVKHIRGSGGFPKTEPQQGANTASVNLLRHQIQTAVLALYYHSLQSVLSAETQRLGLKAHTQLLSNPSLHKSLLAVGSECVMRAASLSGGTDLQFPAVLDIMEIDPANFLTIVECFVRALCSSSSSTLVHHTSPFELPFELKKHLQECEELVLEKLLWESPEPNSPAGYNGGCMQHAIEALQHYCPGPVNDLLWPPLCLLDGTSSETRKEENARIRSEALSRVSSRALQQYHLTVSFVFRKIVTVSARRILDLSELLCLDQFVTEQIWLTWKQLLAEHVGLLYDRHMDQLIICAIYGVCKIARIEPELTFARIFECYYDLNPGKERLNEHIIRHIHLGRDGHQGNVIHLYNQVFVPVAKQQLWKFKYFARDQRSRAGNVNLNDEATLFSESSTFEAKCNFLPVRGIVHAPSPSRIDKTNVYVSSFSDPSSGVKSGNMVLPEEQLSPRPRAMYAFGESSTYDLSLVNKTINYPRFSGNAQVSDEDS